MCNCKKNRNEVITPSTIQSNPSIQSQSSSPVDNQTNQVDEQRINEIKNIVSKYYNNGTKK